MDKKACKDSSEISKILIWKWLQILKTKEIMIKRRNAVNQNIKVYVGGGENQFILIVKAPEIIILFPDNLLY